jgi:multicomponent Na+:H+ antiporter subunit F
MIALPAALATTFAGALFLLRLVQGPTASDRLLAAHALGMIAALTAACIAIALGNAALLDGALALALADAVLVVAAIKALRRNSFQPALAPLHDGGGP